MRGFDWRSKSARWLKGIEGVGALPAIALLTISVAGCSGSSGGKPQAAAATADTNIYPKHYREQIAIYLSERLPDRTDFLGARISQPVLKPVGGTTSHYVVCLQFNARSQINDKAVVYFSGDISQFIDSTPEQCGGAAYQAFAELEQVAPDTDNRNMGTVKMGDGDHLQ